ncbi:MAG: type IV pilus twitching motility protein PilT [Clostridia bacterium]|nr:type IV pilus twitching motility protein PilT [Clostridia bacterium]
MTMAEILLKTVHDDASDALLTVGVPPAYRIYGNYRFENEQKLTAEGIFDMIREVVTPEQMERFLSEKELDLAISYEGLRFRMNAFFQRGKPAVSLRSINNSVKNFETLGIPPILKAYCQKKRGLILVTGPTGSGKSTTLAAIVNQINQTRPCHIISIEDPIEYFHDNDRSIITQREVGTDTLSFASALRGALREDPDVLLIGEMRDPETMATAVTAAETGHLVISTLHTSGSVNTVDRIIDSFPAAQQQQIRSQLSMSLLCVVSQQLIPRKDGKGRVPAFEIMINTPAISSLIRSGKTYMIASSIDTGTRDGMQSIASSLKNLAAKGIISDEELRARLG